MADKRVTIIVPRDAPALYAYLKEAFARDPAVAVIVDRRVGERRQRSRPPGVERRRGDRRKPGRPRAVVVTEE